MWDAAGLKVGGAETGAKLEITPFPYVGLTAHFIDILRHCTALSFYLLFLLSHFRPKYLGHVIQDNVRRLLPNEISLLTRLQIKSTDYSENPI